ncbi:hypothetical protein GCM10007901_17260 [Dyella acidisoli]|uniref:Uncharacterized protein n=2 Tax=Dyella acidisoli TaxID=1867834 RepID=A0ABQ5XQK2_9GAMM|nr:hypothetical protein GCM10007901_17260 [Dyella acidisoli]
MSKMSYLGAMELRAAMVSFESQLAAVASTDSYPTGSIDATFVHNKFETVPVLVSMEHYESKYDPEVKLKIGMSIKLPKCKISKTLTMGSRDEIMSWLARFRDEAYTDKFLRELYIEAEKANDANRLL